MANNLAAGSKADIPQDLLNEIKRLEDLFTVDTQTLKKITDHFISELAKGMATRRRNKFDTTG